MQEVFITLYYKAGSIRDRKKIKSWLAKTAANRAIDFLRRAQKTVTLSDDFFARIPDNTWADPVIEMDKKELVREIHKAIGLLPEETKVLVVLYYFGEIPQKEIAATLGIPPGTVKTRLRRARLAIKNYLQKKDNNNCYDHS
jgi:RNA polymerase sigma-70 factor (ECF subfamily)